MGLTRHLKRNLAIAALFTAAVGVVSLLGEPPSRRDFISYWAAGRLAITGNHPYDRASIFALELRNGFDRSKPLLPRTPPWSLWFMLPLGFLPLGWAWTVWLGICVAGLLISVRLCATILADGDAGARSLFLLLGCGFAPVLACLMFGQIGILLLLGFLIFLRMERAHPFWAGFALILPFSKPHLLISFLVALLFWIVATRRWRLLAGFVVAWASTSLVALAVDPHVALSYWQAMMEESVLQDPVPLNLVRVLRSLLVPNAPALQFAPAVIAAIWSGWYYLRNKERWDWLNVGFLVLLVSMITAPYAMFTDEALLLPILLQAALCLSVRKQLTLATWLLPGASVLLLVLVITGVPVTSAVFCWSGLLWLAWRQMVQPAESSDLPASSARVFRQLGADVRERRVDRVSYGAHAGGSSQGDEGHNKGVFD